MAVVGTTTHRPWVATAGSLLLVGIGLLLVKLCVLDVLEAARRQQAVRLSLKGVLCAPAFIGLGIAATVASLTRGRSGGWARLYYADTRRVRPAGWAVVLGLLAAGGVLYLWLRAQLEGYGYDP